MPTLSTTGTIGGLHVQQDLADLAALEGLISHEAGCVLADLACEVPADVAIVELGSFKGKSTCYLAAGAQRGHGAHVFAVDAWDTHGNVTGRFGYAEPSTRETFERQVASVGLEDAITTLRGFSQVVAGQWPAPIGTERIGRRERTIPSHPVGLLFIDADHGATSVRGDFYAWSPHLAPRAVVVFDDIDTPRNPGVRVVVDELVAAGVIAPVELVAEHMAVSRAQNVL